MSIMLIVVVQLERKMIMIFHPCLSQMMMTQIVTLIDR